MESYKAELKNNSSINNAIVEIKFVDAYSDKTLSVIEADDLVDDYGVKNSDSHYTATMIINDKVVATATGLTRNTAIINCYNNYATAIAIADLDRMMFEDTTMETAVTARRMSENLEIH